MRSCRRKESVMVHVVQKVTSKEGCTVDIDLEVQFGLTGIKSVTGTIVVKPGGSCKTSGTLTFAMAPTGKPKGGKGLTVSLNSLTPSKLSKATWHGDEEVTKLLNSPTVNREF